MAGDVIVIQNAHDVGLAKEDLPREFDISDAVVVSVLLESPGVNLQ